MNRKICEKCFEINDWNMSPINDGRWGKGVYCPKARRWLQHLRVEAPEECEYQMEHIVMDARNEIMV